LVDDGSSPCPQRVGDLSWSSRSDDVALAVSAIDRGRCRVLRLDVLSDRDGVGVRRGELGRRDSRVRSRQYEDGSYRDREEKPEHDADLLRVALLDQRGPRLLAFPDDRRGNVFERALAADPTDRRLHERPTVGARLVTLETQPLQSAARA